MLTLYQKRSFNNNEELLTLAGRYLEKLINSGYYTIDTSINMVTAGLGINLIGLDKKINKISGGQCAKVILAKLLLEKLDVLLLDKLTNFLDTKHIN